ncbi:MAG: AAA family ATPase [Nanoarchaeota archaeon]|nr:AAA family ATPase [Nanoarchaeota archaeon]
MKFKKIFIFGLMGSGKTTLAKIISNYFKIPYYTTDNFVYIRNSEKRRSIEESKKIIKKISDKEKWIIEGAHNREWVKDTVKKADLVIFLNPSKIVMAKRIILNRKNKFRLLYGILRWGPKTYRDYKKIVKKFVELKNKKEINNFLKKIK